MRYQGRPRVSGSIGCDRLGILYDRRRNDCNGQYRFLKDHAAKLEKNSPNIDNEEMLGGIDPNHDTSRSESFCY
mgnify:CR=1 FL=1